MGRTLTTSPLSATAVARPLSSEDDPLDAIRGIIFGVLLSIAGFWMPLALAIAW